MLTGVILAGGQNRRMNGKMKSFLIIDHETILERQLYRMQRICREVIIVTNQPEMFHHFNMSNRLKIITDNVPGKGPLSGMHAVIPHASGENLWIVGCDMPYVSPKAAKILLDQKQKLEYDAAVPVVNGRTHPLHGIYAREILPILDDLLREGEYKVRSFLDEISWLPIHEELLHANKIDSRFIMNLNTPQEYEYAFRGQTDDH